MSVVDAPVKEEPMRLGDRDYLALLHRFFELLPRLFGDQLYRTALVHLAYQKQVTVAMALFQLLYLSLVFLDYPWIVDLEHGLIMLLVSWIGITIGSAWRAHRSPGTDAVARAAWRGSPGGHAPGFVGRPFRVGICRTSLQPALFAVGLLAYRRRLLPHPR